MKLVTKTSDADINDVYTEKYTIEYTQDLNTWQSEEDYEEPYQKLILTTEDNGAGKFIHMILGESGWSIDPDDIEDFVKILRHFKHVIELEPE